MSETKQPRLRSKRGHERRINGTIYTVLVVMSVVWLVPFVFLVLQSFRSYKLEKGGMVDYLIPKTFSLDNYAFLFEGSSFFQWLPRALLISAAVAVVSTLVVAGLGAALERGDANHRTSLLTMIITMVACYAGLAFAACRVHGHAMGDRMKLILLCLPVFVVGGMALSQVFLKQDDKLLRSLPGYVAEEHYRGPKRAVFLALELFTLCLIIQLTITPMVTSQYLRWYGNTLTIALFTAVIQTAIVLSVSYALSRLRFKGRKLIMNAVLVLGLFPGFLTMITLYFLLKQMGLTQAGAVPGLILIYCASSGMGYYISKGYFDTIPKSLDESARIDGATRFQVFLKIIMTLGDRIVIMKDGYIQQVGTPQEVFEAPRNLFVAGFIGSPQMNFMKARLVKDGSGYAAEVQGIRVPLGADKCEKLSAKGVGSRDVILGVRPEHTQLCFGDEPGSIAGTLRVNEMMGSELHLHVDLPDGASAILRIPTLDLTEQQRAGLTYGTKLRFTFPEKVTHLFDPQSEESLLI